MKSKFPSAKTINALVERDVRSALNSLGPKKGAALAEKLFKSPALRLDLQHNLIALGIWSMSVGDMEGVNQSGSLVRKISVMSAACAYSKQGKGSK